MLIDRREIQRLMPHEGDMCLLDAVQEWDKSRIRCVSATHRSMDNPLRRDGSLGILCGIEYAAQAMALHAALADQNPGSPVANEHMPGGQGVPRQGYLASVRAVRCHADRLDQFPGCLLVDAERLHGDAGRAIYSFALHCRNRLLLEGRAAVAMRLELL